MYPAPTERVRCYCGAAGSAGFQPASGGKNGALTVEIGIVWTFLGAPAGRRHIETWAHAMRPHAKQAHAMRRQVKQAHAMRRQVKQAHQMRSYISGDAWHRPYRLKRDCRHDAETIIINTGSSAERSPSLKAGKLSRSEITFFWSKKGI
jgi:hypothetical protein